MTLKPLMLITLVVLLGSCGFGRADLVFDIEEINSSPNRNLSLERSDSHLPPGNSTWYSPTSFVINVGTIALNDEDGVFVTLFDAPDDADCIAIDLAAGESLQDICR